MYYTRLVAPNGAVVQFQSSEIMNSMAIGQHVQVGQNYFTIRDMLHGNAQNGAVVDCYVTVYLAAFAGLQGGTNPVPWP
jgi:hypothetical protein